MKELIISDIESENQENVFRKYKTWLKMALMCLILNSCASSYEIVIEHEPIEIKTTKKAIER